MNMRSTRRRTFIAVLVLGLAAMSCSRGSVSADFTQTAPTHSVTATNEDAVDPNWHLRQEELATSDPNGTESSGDDATAPPVVPTAVATLDEDVGVDGEGETAGMTLYFTRSGGQLEVADQTRDLYSLDTVTGKVTQLTIGQHIITAALAPDGVTLAYRAYDGISQNSSLVHVIDLTTGADRRVATIGYYSRLNWTPDGSAVVHGIDVDDRPSIGLLDITSGEVAVAVEAELTGARQRGMSGNQVLYEDGDGRTNWFARHDLTTGEFVDRVEVPPGQVDVSQDGSLVIIVGRNTGEMSLIDLRAEAMVVQSLPSGPGSEAGLRISPDNQYIAYGIGPDWWAPTDMYISPLDAPETRVSLTEKIETTEVREIAWAPDSKSVFFADRSSFESQMYVATIDGVVAALGETGWPLFVVANEPPA